MPFFAISPIQYTGGSHRAAGSSPAAFLLPEKRKGEMVSHSIASRDFVCQSPNQKPPGKAALPFGGCRPQSPGKERCVWGRIYESVRVTAKEKEKIQSKARKCGLSTTEYVKQRALGYEPKGIPPDALFVCLEKLDELADKASSPELDEGIYTVLKQITAAFLLPGKV